MEKGPLRDRDIPFCGHNGLRCDFTSSREFAETHIQTPFQGRGMRLYSRDVERQQGSVRALLSRLIMLDVFRTVYGVSLDSYSLEWL